MSEHTVHDECDTYHVSAVFKNRQEKEQDCHLWNESKYCSKSANDTIHYKSVNQVTCSDIRKESSDCILDCSNECIICPVCYKCTYCCDRYVIYKPHNCDKNRNTKDSVCNDTVNLIRCCQFFFCFFNSSSDNLLDKLITSVSYNTFHIVIMFLFQFCSFIFNNCFCCT